MNKLFLIILFSALVQISYAQVSSSKQDEIQRLQSIQTQTAKTMIIDISAYSLNTIGELKDEIVMWKEKITAIEINENSHQLKITHNGLLNDRELYDVLTKYNIKNSKIISYQ